MLRETGMAAASRIAGVAVVLALTGLLTGCAEKSGGSNGDPGAKPLPAGQSCQSVRGELNKLDSRGVPAKVERATAGQKLSPADKADVDRYNQMLNYYLGARCHV